MQCPSCRQESSGSFCSFCGTAFATAGIAGAAARSTSAGSGLSPNTVAAIAYLTIIPSIIFLALAPYKQMKLVRFHSIQNIAFTVAMTIVYIVLASLSATLGLVVPFIGFLFLFLDLTAGALFFIAWLVALLKASQGESFRLPLVGAFAAKQAGI